MHLVVGLGNPGRRYAQTRHNAGFQVIDRLADRWGGSVARRQFGALVDRVAVDGADVVLAKPQDYMNRSGQPVASLRGFYKLAPTELIVVHDEMDLDFGTVRVKQAGGHGGHNGIRDVQARLGSNDFVRVRVGVSRPPEGWDPADWVLAPFTAAEREQLPEVIDRAADAVERILRDGAQNAMAVVNARRPRRHQVEGPGKAAADSQN